MSIQAEIDDEFQDDMVPQTVISLENESGSFELKAGMMVIAQSCSDAMCTAAPEGNSVSWYSSTGAGITGGMKGLFRFDQCTGGKQIEAQDSEVNIGGGDFQSITLERCKVLIIGGTKFSGDCKFTDCDVTLLKGQFTGDVTVSGGVLRDEECQYQGDVTISGGTIIQGRSAQLTGDLSVTGSNGTLKGYQVTGDSTISSSHIVAIDGTYTGDLDISDSSTAVLKGDLTLSGELTATGGFLTLIKLDLTSNLTIEQGCQLVVSGGSLQQFQATGAGAVLKGCTVSSNATITDTACRFDGVTVTGEADFESSPLDSTGCTWGSEMTMSGGTITSSGDTASGEWTITGLVGPNYIKSLTADNLDISGTSNSTINLENCTSPSCTIDNFSIAQINGGSLDTLELTSMGTAIVSCTSEEVIVTEVSQFFGAGGFFTELTITGASQAVTQECANVTATDCVLSDQGSTITATACVINGKNSIVTGTGISGFFQGSTVNGTNIAGVFQESEVSGANVAAVMTGGTGVLTGLSAALVSGAAITNLGGYTSGCGFDQTLQGGSTHYSPIALSLQATVGDVDITSVTGAITVNSALATSMTSLGAFTILSGATFSLTSVGTASLSTGVTLTLSGSLINLN